MKCEKYKKLIEKYLDGIIDDMELTALKSHTESCSACRDEFQQCRQMQSVITEGLSANKSAEQAREAVLSSPE